MSSHELLRGYSNNPSRNDKILSKLAGSRNKSHMVITNYLKQHFSSMLLSSFSIGADGSKYILHCNKFFVWDYTPCGN